MTYSVTPHDHTSAISPAYCFLESTSGAMYAGVPTVDLGCESNRADCTQIHKSALSLLLSIKVLMGLEKEVDYCESLIV